MHRIASGVQGLDEVLGGGIPSLSSTIIAGAPGSGKTVLAHNILFSSDVQETVLYISTMSESQIKVLRYQQQFGYFDVTRFMSSVMFEDVAAYMLQGHKRVMEAIEASVKRHRPSLLVIDSFRAVADLALTPIDRRSIAYDLSLRASVWGCTLLLVGEYTEDDISIQPEFAVVDGILYLYGTEEHRSQRRYMRVMKMRGSASLPGEHPLTITSAGIATHPRRAAVASAQKYALAQPSRQQTGVPGLDDMLSGGIPEGTTTILVGPTGSGKSLMALSWLVQGARTGEPGVLVSYDSPPESIIRHTAGFGWDIPALMDQGLLHIVHLSPVEVGLEMGLDVLAKLVDKHGVRRAVVDSISAVQLGIRNQTIYTDYLWGLADWFKLNGRSLMMVAERAYVADTIVQDDAGFSYLADNLLSAEYRGDGLRLDRFVRVIKMRGSSHDQCRRPLVITHEGPRILLDQNPGEMTSPDAP